MIDFRVDSEIKQDYLRQKPTQTAKAESFILRLADEYEAMVGKPIYNMTYSEIEEMLFMQFRNTSEGVVCKNISILKTYIDFCIRKNIVLHGENRLSVFRSEDARKYTDSRAVKGRFISRDRLEMYQNILYNEQDKLILKLPYIGVGGKALEEMRNLTIDDIDKENKLLKLTTDEGEHRLISIDDSTIRLIKNAYGQLFYTENNGMETYSSRNPEPKKTKINSVGRYVFRVPGQKKFSKLTHSFFISRMSRFKKWLNNPYLTYNALRDSGIVQSAIDKEKNGEITRDDYMDIYDRFNYRVGSNEIYWYTIRALVDQYREIL